MVRPAPRHLLARTKERFADPRPKDGCTTLALDGAQSRVMVKEYQLDPITHHLLHADFYQLAMDKAITVTVPIEITGVNATSAARKFGQSVCIMLEFSFPIISV